MVCSVTKKDSHSEIESQILIKLPLLKIHECEEQNAEVTDDPSGPVYGSTLV